MTLPDSFPYRGDHADPARVDGWLAHPPPWRAVGSVPTIDRPAPTIAPDSPAERRGARYVPPDDEASYYAINLALLLRRPLLVTGDPGLGKSTLAWHLAWALGLGPPLRWEITSATRLQDGLWRYDAVGHLQQAQSGSTDIGEHIRLGPLGTALLPWERPRVLLIDELDKASYDLPNDLLHTLEEGRFLLDDLVRTRGGTVSTVDEPDDVSGWDGRVTLPSAVVRCAQWPVVVITSNADREFPPAFLRRCVPLKLERPSGDRLRRIVEQRFDDPAALALVRDLPADAGHEATDVVLNLLFAMTHSADPRLTLSTLRRSGRRA